MCDMKNGLLHNDVVKKNIVKIYAIIVIIPIRDITIIGGMHELGAITRN